MSIWDFLPAAFQVGIKPSEFWEMTLREVNLCIRAGNERLDNDRYYQAYLTACIMNAHPLKRTVKADDLYQIKRKKLKPKFNPADMIAKAKAAFNG